MSVTGLHVGTGHLTYQQHEEHGPQSGMKDPEHSYPEPAFM